MKKEKLYSGSEVFLIFKNYGVLGASMLLTRTEKDIGYTWTCCESMMSRWKPSTANIE